jgi:voltage-gated potassium channel
MINKEYIYKILEPSTEGDRLSKIFDLTIISLVMINVTALIIETVPSMEVYSNEFFIFEAFSVSLFTVEYFLRIYTCTTDKRYSSPVSGRIKFIFTPILLLDLLAILPFYLIFLGVDLRFLRVLRLMRIFRLLRLTRYIKSMSTISHAIKNKGPDIVIALAMILIMLVISASLMYLAENEAQPEAFSSIPASMWWAVATLTTVGYGDVYPITVLGKIMASMIALLGIAAIAVPTGIITSSFTSLSDKEDD